ncbi:MAG TPA: LacI family DNA-binding transcriptional regulator [Lacunisphaera sp.]|nr:LacI family DNA-binding transcriptional regulator [Lacunisphaera sp.]
MDRSTPVYPAKPTVVEVAVAANVAVGTVSRVLNTPDVVGPEIRQRVLDAIARVHYTPLRRRRRFRLADGPRVSGRRGNLGLLLVGMDESLSNLPVISEALHGVELAVAAKGMNLMLANLPNADRVPAFLARNQVDGLIVKCPLLGDLRACARPALVAAIKRLPHVWLLGRPESAGGDVCGFDFDSGAQTAVEYLRARGHRHVAFLEPRPGQTRSEGLKRALAVHAQRLGLHVRHLEKLFSFPVKWPVPAVTDPAEIVPLVARWESLPAGQRPTALVVSADSIAVQLYAALRLRGHRVGRDVSVLSFNHEKTLVMNLDPALTTLDVCAEAIGRRAVEQLLWRVDNPREDVPTRILLEPRLVEGNSVATLRTAV